jgi:hypothetical protein
MRKIIAVYLGIKQTALCGQNAVLSLVLKQVAQVIRNQYALVLNFMARSKEG